MKLDVNTDAAIQLTARLEKLHRSAFPSAVRNTLNDAAFMTKTLVPKKAEHNFTIRQKNVFSRLTVVDKAKGFDLNSMKSIVGINANAPKSTKLAEGLEKQELGGSIQGRKLVPHNLGRISGSYAKKVQSKNQFSKIGGLGTPRNRIKGAKYILIKKSGSNGTVFNTTGNRLKPVYTYRNTKTSRVKAKPFLYPSALEAQSQMSNFYKKNAEFQFKKALKL